MQEITILVTLDNGQEIKANSIKVDAGKDIRIYPVRDRSFLIPLHRIEKIEPVLYISPKGN